MVALTDRIPELKITSFLRSDKQKKEVQGVTNRKPKVVELFGVSQAINTGVKSASQLVDTINSARTVVSAFGQKKEH